MPLSDNKNVMIGNNCICISGQSKGVQLNIALLELRIITVDQIQL